MSPIKCIDQVHSYLQQRVGVCLFCLFIESEVLKMRDYTPKELYQILSRSVLGQDDYLQKISTTIWLHNKRIEAIQKNGDVKLQKYNLLCVGPTGSGKTLAISILAEMFGLDILIVDASTFTGAGYRGRDVEEIIHGLYVTCGQDRTRTERAVVVMDEIDKMVLQNLSDRDPAGSAENVLLKIVEGTVVEINSKFGKTSIDTSSILFIACGAFEGIEEIVKKRTQVKSSIGFGSRLADDPLQSKDPYLLITKNDLLDYGMGSQFLGRFANVATLHKLDAATLANILLRSKASIVKNLDDTLRFSCGLRVSIDPLGAKAVAEQAAQADTGARGLNQVIMPLLDHALFEHGGDSEVIELVITADRSGSPIVDLVRGEREKKAKKTDVYHWPKPINRGAVETLAWCLMAPYLDEAKLVHRDIKAMHALLCSVIYYIDQSCSDDDCTFDSIQKLIKHSRPESGDGDETTYEILLCKEKLSHPEACIDAEFYYGSFKQLDPKKRTPVMLMDALDQFARVSTLQPRLVKIANAGTTIHAS